MSSCVVTGGAGFIGSALSGPLADEFDQVIAFDNLLPQVHASRTRPERLDPRVELVVGDVTRTEDWNELLAEHRPDVVVHLAAETGTAQSLTEATRHAEVNVVGTTQMLDAFARHKLRPRSIVLASSRAVYGEGAWSGTAGTVCYPGQRSHEMLAAHRWEFADLTPMRQRSDLVRPEPTSVYGATKLCQENVLASWCRSMGVPAVLFRLQNVYGPGQSLTNPYTGIVPLFARIAREGGSIPVYEDGEIVRDFVYIDDVVSALVAGTHRTTSNEHPFDVGSGNRTTIDQLAQLIARRYGAPAPHVTGQFRDGDVRAAVADITLTGDELRWRPRVGLETGMNQLCDWIDGHEHV
ncbi:MAG: NAD-dependent epimerase/dehydratase family protein [Cellulomonadaceae bacterium]